jgi:hypothetical protein
MQKKRLNRGLPEEIDELLVGLNGVGPSGSRDEQQTAERQQTESGFSPGKTAVRAGWRRAAIYSHWSRYLMSRIELPNNIGSANVDLER